MIERNVGIEHRAGDVSKYRQTAKLPVRTLLLQRLSRGIWMRAPPEGLRCTLPGPPFLPVISQRHIRGESLESQPRETHGPGETECGRSAHAISINLRDATKYPIFRVHARTHAATHTQIRGTFSCQGHLQIERY